MAGQWKPPPMPLANRSRGRPKGTIKFDDADLFWRMAQLMVRPGFKASGRSGVFRAAQAVVADIPDCAWWPVHARENNEQLRQKWAADRRLNTADRLRRDWNKFRQQSNALLLRACHQRRSRIVADIRWCSRWGPGWEAWSTAKGRWRDFVLEEDGEAVERDCAGDDFLRPRIVHPAPTVPGDWSPWPLSHYAQAFIAAGKPADPRKIDP